MMEFNKQGNEGVASRPLLKSTTSGRGGVADVGSWANRKLPFSIACILSCFAVVVFSITWSHVLFDKGVPIKTYLWLCRTELWLALGVGYLWVCHYQSKESNSIEYKEWSKDNIRMHAWFGFLEHFVLTTLFSYTPSEYRDAMDRTHFFEWNPRIFYLFSLFVMVVLMHALMTVNKIITLYSYADSTESIQKQRHQHGERTRLG